MKKNVAMIEIGSDSEMTKVLQPSRRNRKMTRIDSSPPITASSLTSAMAWRMNLDWSSTGVISMSAGSRARISASLASSASAVATVLASPSL